MSLIEMAVKRPVAVLSFVFIILLMGGVALNLIPIQLTPDLRKPYISISTRWPGASPTEVEREITNRQEDALKGLNGLEKITSSSRDGSVRMGLTFNIDTNMDRALMLVNNALTNINGLPSEARTPRIHTRDSEDNPIAWFVMDTVEGNDKGIFTYKAFIEDVVQDRLERLPGLAVVNVWGGNLKQLQVIVDPQKMARFRLTVSELVTALRNANASVSAGEVAEGKRRYVVRTDNELTTVDRVMSLVIRSQVDVQSGRISRVTLADVAEVKFDYTDTDTGIRNMGKRAIVINMIRDTGVNVIEVMKEIKKEVVELNAGPLKQAGLKMTQTHDDTTYISSAIGLVQQNILVGGTLAVLLLLLFLRSWRATLVVSLAIPVSIIGSFVAMAALGRSINVISLAGIAFAVGMVVDAAIVVLENIFRLRQQGRPPFEAAVLGARQVWGAVFVSAVTTVMVFIPILVMKLEVGQLFRDIAVAISVAVILSLIVSITVIPSLANRLLRGQVKDVSQNFRVPVVDWLAGLFSRLILVYVRRVIASRIMSIGTFSIILVTTVGVTVSLFPKLDYLPEGNRNLVIARLIPPPGYNFAAITRMAEKAEAYVRPLMAPLTGPESKPGEPPKMSRFWFIIRRGFTVAAAAAVDPARAGELVPVLRRAVFSEPGSRGFVRQTSIFGRGFGGGRNIDLDISGPDLDDILNVAARGFQLVGEVLPRSDDNQVRAIPGLQLSVPEVRILPDSQRLADNGITARELGLTIDAFNDGIRVAEVTVEGRRIDLTVRGPLDHIDRTEDIANIPVVTRSGRILPVSSLAKVVLTASPSRIRHSERERTITLRISPSRTVPLEAAMDTVRTEVMEKLQAEGLPPGVRLRMSGTADALTKTRDSMVVNLSLAVVIVYLVMAILFESFLYPFIIIFTVPLAAAGGFIGLRALNLITFQALDMLTMLGFVILIGIVVNNAILLVHQTLIHVREEAMAARDAIMEATRNRIRPIFMSTLTSICGMAPLAVFPGAGSELYRGLGSVVIGGLALSAILTLLIVPPLLGLFANSLEKKRARGDMKGGAPAAAAAG